MSRTGLWIAVVAVALAVVGWQVTFADSGGDDAFLTALSTSKISLADGVAQAGAKAPEVAISAKFEMDDNGKLSLSVYTAEKGLETDAEHNVLKELSGDPTGGKWTPEVEVFKDAEHLKRAAGQHTLMSISAASLLDIIRKAGKDHPGTVFSAIPVVRGHRAAFLVQIASNGKAVEYLYDLTTGNAVKE